MLTRDGVCYNLQVSPFIYKTKDITFLFSSRNHMEKFKKSINDFRNITNEKLSKRYGFDIVNNTLADITLYMKIESRGFLLRLESGEFVCKENLTLNGENVILKSLNVQSEILTEK
jgi:hypothetical protein